MVAFSSCTSRIRGPLFMHHHVLFVCAESSTLQSRLEPAGRQAGGRMGGVCKLGDRTGTHTFGSAVGTAKVGFLLACLSNTGGDLGF